MKCLIVRQPWVDMILSGEKTWEMRSRKTNVRGRVGLIEQGSGLIVGECDIVDCIDRSDVSANALRFRDFEKHKVGCAGALSKWNKAWVIANAVRYDAPVPYNHPRGAVIWVNT